MGERARILIVEDEALIALDIEDSLRSAGFEIAAIASGVDQALAALDTDIPDAAVLDANLSGRSGAEVAVRLRKACVPFVVVSGYGRDQIDWLEDAPLATKPVNMERLQEHLATAIRHAPRA
ncbi:MAG: response regulator [Oceanicaulis sp.]